MSIDTKKKEKNAITITDWEQIQVITGFGIANCKLLLFFF